MPLCLRIYLPKVYTSSFLLQQMEILWNEVSSTSLFPFQTLAGQVQMGFVRRPHCQLLP